MHYQSIHDLPPPVRHVLPELAQEIYLGSFNETWEENADTPAREQAAEQAAWAAVKERYEKLGDGWQPRERLEEGPSGTQATGGGVGAVGRMGSETRGVTGHESTGREGVDAPSPLGGRERSHRTRDC